MTEISHYLWVSGQNGESRKFDEEKIGSQKMRPSKRVGMVRSLYLKIVSFS